MALEEPSGTKRTSLLDGFLGRSSAIFSSKLGK